MSFFLFINMETRYKIIKNKRELKKLIACCKATGYACCDYETNAEPIYNKSFKPTILSVSWMPGFGASIPLDHFQTKEYTSPGWNWKKMLRKFGEEIIENYDIVKVAWNWKFDDQINQKYHIYYRGTCLDGMLAKYVLNEEKPHGLKDMVRRYLPEYGDYEKQDKFDKIPWDKKELDPLCKYGCQDTDFTLRLMIFFEKKLIDLKMYSVFRNLFMCNSRVLTSVEKEGLYLDTEFNQKLLEEYKPKIDAARQAIYDLPRVKKFTKKYNQVKIEKYIESIEAELEELDYNDPKDKRKIDSREQKISNIRAGIFTTKKEQELIRPLNLGSPVDLPQLMYSDSGFKFPVIKNNESGKPSTDEDTLVELRLTIKDPESPKAIFLDKLLELRGLQKMYTTYIEGWHEKVQDDSRLHGRYNIHGTDSNRFSSADPNMQQIPKTSVDPNIKKQLVAPPGYLYMAFDYSQAELRMMAHLSGDETYLEDALLAVKLSDPKAGIIVTKEEARKEMDEFFKKHPKILKFKEKQEKFLRKHGYYTQLFGTKRRLPQIYSNDKQEVAYAIRLGLNFPCQGAAANMTNFGAILVYWLMRQGKLPMMKEACTVHDAVYMYSKPKDINTWTVYTIWNILRNPSTKKYFGFQVDDVDMDMDFTIGRTMAEELPFIPGYDYNKMLQPDFSVDEYMAEHKKYKHIHIKQFKERFNKQIKAYEKDFEWTHDMAS